MKKNKLPCNQFYMNLERTLFSMKDKEKILEQHIQTCLYLLPQGTTFVSFEEPEPSMEINPLLCVKVVFENPLMQKYKEVVIEYVRDCAIIDGHLERFNKIVALTYIKR